MTWRVGIAAVVTALFAVWRGGFGDPVTDALERRLLDLRFQVRGPWESVDTVAVVAFDEAAAAEFPGATQRRRALAEALPLILAGGARAVAIDMIFAEATGADPQLAMALAASDRIVIAASAQAAAALGDLASPELDAALSASAIPVVVAEAVAVPAPGLAILPTPRLASAARLGHVNFARAQSGGLYAAPLALDVADGRVLPALALKAAAIHLGGTLTLLRGRVVLIGDRPIPVDRGERLVIDHPGGVGATPTYGLLAVLAGATPPGAFAGRTVFIGGSSESLGDIFTTPFAPDISGVEVNAGLAAGLISGRWVTRDEQVVAASGAAALLLCLAAAATGRARRRDVFVGSLALIWAVGVAGTQLAFAEWGIWLDATTILAGLGFGSVAGAGDGVGALIRQSARLSRERANLARFVAPHLAQSLARDRRPGFDRRSQTATVLFVDVAGFTQAAETATGERLTAYLEQLHAHFEAASAAHDATIIDFQGDGAMLVFGLPEPLPDDPARALACAFWLASREPPLFGDPEDEDGGRRLALRISAHHGPVTAAVLGGRAQSVVTVAGDTVNLASRLQEIAKEIGAGIVTTRETLEASAPGATDWPGWTFHSRRPVRGREQSAEIWVGRAAREA